MGPAGWSLLSNAGIMAIMFILDLQACLAHADVLAGQMLPSQLPALIVTPSAAAPATYSIAPTSVPVAPTPPPPCPLPTAERTIRFHYANCSTFNAVCDGDEINLHLPLVGPLAGLMFVTI